MQRSIRIVFALAFCVPVMGHANEVDVPELGIKFFDLPSSASTPQVNERPAGYEATVYMGEFATSLSIYRQENPVSPGSIADAAYRASLQTEFDDNSEWKGKGTLTAVDGHDAWTIVDTRRAGP